MLVGLFIFTSGPKLYSTVHLSVISATSNPPSPVQSGPAPHDSPPPSPPHHDPPDRRLRAGGVRDRGRGPPPGAARRPPPAPPPRRGGGGRATHSAALQSQGLHGGPQDQLVPPQERRVPRESLHESFEASTFNLGAERPRELGKAVRVFYLYAKTLCVFLFFHVIFSRSLCSRGRTRCSARTACAASARTASTPTSGCASRGSRRWLG